MDYGTFNGLYTLFLIIIFVALIIWAYSKKRKKTFDDIANSIFDEVTDQTNAKVRDNTKKGAEK